MNMHVRLVHNTAAALDSTMIGRQLIVETASGPVSGGLSDIVVTRTKVKLFLGGRVAIVSKSAKVVYDTLH